MRNNPKSGERALRDLDRVIAELAPREPDAARELRFLRQEFAGQIRSRVTACQTLSKVTKALHEATAENAGR